MEPWLLVSPLTINARLSSTHSKRETRSTGPSRSVSLLTTRYLSYEVMPRSHMAVVLQLELDCRAVVAQPCIAAVAPCTVVQQSKLHNYLIFNWCRLELFSHNLPKGASKYYSFSCLYVISPNRLLYPRPKIGS